ncbi:MAG TPA: substrate-binding domain-containing protein [Polyangiaceae bacterium]|nr:substrate-binding domain-containing protein [Polyangiaceae bacterium]
MGISAIFFCGGVIESPDPNSVQRNALYDLIDPDRIDGVIVLTPVGNHIGPEALSAYCSRFAPLPICAVGVELRGHPRVLVDDASGMRQLLDHFILAHGRRRIAFLRGPPGNEQAGRRYAVYLEVLQRHGIAFDPALVTIGDFNAPSGAEGVRLLCGERKAQIDAVVAANDLMALGAMEALQGLGFDVPRQVGVAGFDDIDEARFASPPLTTVRQPLSETGRHAARVVIAMLEGGDRPERLMLDTSLVLRESCGCSIDEVVGVRASREPSPSASIVSALRERRDEVLHALRRAVSPEYARIGADWVEPLFDAFLADVAGASGARGDRFVTVLDATLRRVIAAGGSIRPWHAVVSIIKSASADAGPERAEHNRAADVLHRARILIGDLGERVQAQHRIHRERWIRTLHETSEALMTALGEPALVDAIAGQLGRLQIPACAVAAYERSSPSPLRLARPIFLSDGGRRMDPALAVFDPRKLAPGRWMDARPRTLVAEPLAFHGEQLGFALFEVGPKDGAVYEGLRELVSGAMKKARLVEQVVDEATRRQRAERERLEKEMEIAARIQTTIIPKGVLVPGLDIAAIMIPASEVGGDYYDVIPCDGGCWIGVGDVAGHGLQTGLVMVMIQSIVAALIRRDSRSSPSEVYGVLNAVLYENVRRRMSQDEHATLTLLRYEGGRFVCAGAHEDIIVFRRSRGECESFETRGPWVGAVPTVDGALVEMSISLEVGDIMVLYTDGVTEAKDARGVQFGLERVRTIVERVSDQPVQSVRDHLVAAVRSWTQTQEDDVSLIVVRRTR